MATVTQMLVMTPSIEIRSDKCNRCRRRSALQWLLLSHAESYGVIRGHNFYDWRIMTRADESLSFRDLYAAVEQ